MILTFWSFYKLFTWRFTFCSVRTLNLYQVALSSVTLNIFGWSRKTPFTKPLTVSEVPLPVVDEIRCASLIKTCEGSTPTYDQRRYAAILRHFIDRGLRLAEATSCASRLGIILPAIIRE
jgi:hypothetical protein